MVVFIDLSRSPSPTPSPLDVTDAASAASASATPNPNRAHPFSRCLAQYPFLASLSSHLDHNDLYNLSSTCRQFHAELSAYRRTLLQLSLRCGNDRPPVAATSAPARTWRDFRGGGRCAKDLVNRCLRCTEPVCRNCTQKPHPSHTHSRFRRLCPACQTDPALLPRTDITEYERACGASRRACACEDNAWLCSPCAKSLAIEDHEYRLQCEMWVQEFLPARERGSDVSADGKWGPVRCARGRDCSDRKGAEGEEAGKKGGKGEKGEKGEEGEGEGRWWWDERDRAAEGEEEERRRSHGSDGWDSFEAAMEERAGEDWEGAGMAARKSPGSKRRKGRGREVAWDRDGWALVYEWKGQRRGWCAWCDSVVLSLADREALE